MYSQVCKYTLVRQMVQLQGLNASFVTHAVDDGVDAFGGVVLVALVHGDGFHVAADTGPLGWSFFQCLYRNEPG